MLATVVLSALLSLACMVSAAPSPRDAGLPRLAGVNLAGCEFGMETDGSANGFKCPPLSQVGHFKKHGANLIRLPIGWQYLIDSRTDSSVDGIPGEKNIMQEYDALVRETTKGGGTYAIIDVHNYARFNGQIIGHKGSSVTTQHFATLWWHIANRYKDNPKVIFALMNEPHGPDLDMAQWARTCQSAINAIRAAGARDQVILITGGGYSSIGEYMNSNNDALLSITDPARPGSTSHIHFDAHMYIDPSRGGKTAECDISGVEGLSGFAAWLGSKGRKAMMTEIGAGDNANCHRLFGEQLAYLSANPNVFSGWTVWSAGSFNPDTYPLSIVPKNGENNGLFINAIKPHLPGSG